MFRGIEALPKIPDRRIVHEIQIGFRVLDLIVFQHVHDPCRHTDADAPVFPGGIDADQAEINHFRMSDRV